MSSKLQSNLFSPPRQALLLARGDAPKESRRSIRSSASFLKQASLLRIIDQNAHRLAFAGIYLFTLLLYIRPNEMFPGLFGTFPFAKIVAIITPALYLGGQLSKGQKVTIWTTEVKMLIILITLAILFTPVAVSPKDSYDMLTDTYIKVVLIFLLMINVITTRERLTSLLRLVVLCGVWLGMGAIRSYMRGEFTARGERIEGLVGGIFGNPNDLATALNMLVPLAVTLALTSKNLWRLFYILCTLVMMFGIIVTFSRGGFLGLIAVAAVMVWKLGRGRRLKTVVISTLVAGVLLTAMPGGYGKRLATIFQIDADETGSAQERRNLIERTANLAIRRPIVGVGMGNLHIYSIKEQVAHNAYLEVAAELSMFGLIAYLIFIFAPFKSLRQIEDDTSGASPGSVREMNYLSIGIQSAILAYVVCSFFASIQYLWYIYYATAYAISLRRIYVTEACAETTPETTALTLVSPRKASLRGSLFNHDPGSAGTLWRARSRSRR